MKEQSSARKRTMKTGVELEYWTVDQEGKLSSSNQLASRLEFAEQEFVEPMLEIKTDPFENLSEIRSQIKRRLESAIEEAESLGQEIVALGTPLNSRKIETVPSERSDLQEKIVGENLEYAKHVAGTHFHFEQTDAVKQLNLLTALDPALALTSSSRHYQGKRTAQNARNQVYRYRCYEELPGHGQLWSYISGIDEWEERIESRFNEFREKAYSKGIEEKVLEEHFKPEESVWVPVRLRDEFGTVEWRSPDSTHPTQILQLLQEIEALVEKAGERELETGKASIEDGKILVPEFRNLRQLSKKAIQKGLKNPEVRKYLQNLGFDTSSFQPVSTRIRKDEISIQEAQDIRLKHAKKLKEDVRHL